jgi:hypothetical protein
MSVEDLKLIDTLIEAGWRVVESGFDPLAFDQWRQTAFDCLLAIFGPHHAYTQYFAAFVKRPDTSNLLAGGGLLVAAKQHALVEEFKESKSGTKTVAPSRN